MGITVSLLVATVISAVSISSFGHDSAKETLTLLCETGKNSLNYYFKSVEQSIDSIGDLLSGDLKDVAEGDFNDNISNHVHYADTLFKNVAAHTNGVLTYYYRIDPDITKATNEAGFWYVDLKGQGFVPHEVTPLDSADYECRWYFDTQEAKHPIWLPPYATDNLFDEEQKEVYVVSYNYPIIYHGDVVAVAGIEIGYGTLGEQIQSIRAFETGFAFIVENQNVSIIYHPTIDTLRMEPSERPQPPAEFVEGFRSGEQHVEYTIDNVRKHSCWKKLSNGMSIVVAVPEQEIQRTWMSLVTRILLVAIGLIAAFVLISVFYARRFTKPLKELRVAAEEINRGNYNVELKHNGDDEIGVLTDTVRNLVGNLGEYIDDLNALAYGDALTSVSNKGAFNIAMADLQKRIDNHDPDVEFAIAILDCDNLKEVNDAYGHDKGDIYIRNTSNLIGRVFKNSTVYRLGGDEFGVILTGEDYRNREILVRHFVEKMEEICAVAKDPWEQIHVSLDDGHESLNSGSL